MGVNTSSSIIRVSKSENSLLSRNNIPNFILNISKEENAKNIKIKKCTSSKDLKVRALYNFSPTKGDDLKFRKGDCLFVSSDTKKFWWYAKHALTHETGFIPSNYVVIDDGSPESLDGWFPINRIECEKKLILPGYDEGTYIIRPVAKSACYSLSIRVFDSVNKYFIVKHYKITKLDNGHYHIGAKNRFANFKSLILYYRRNIDDLCCLLKKPFPKVRKPIIHFRDIEVNRDCLLFKRVIGRGNFGEVWLAKWNNSVNVAIKMLKDNSLNNFQREALLNEAKFMNKLHHPKIVEILGISSEPVDQPVLLITEFMSNGTLLGFLKSDKGKNLDLKDMILMMSHIADGMSYLESENFVHRDLRAANILVAEDMTVKVADFGLSSVMEGINDPSEMAFPVRWTAPEAGLRHKFSSKSDVWSFGVLMYEIVTYGRLPYEELELKRILIATDRGLRLKIPDDNRFKCSSQLSDIMMSCWEAYPDKRPTFIYLRDVFGDIEVYNEVKYENNAVFK